LIEIEEIKNAIEDMGFDAVVQPNAIPQTGNKPVLTDDLISFTDDHPSGSSVALIRSTSNSSQAPTKNGMAEVVIGVTGMHCKSCVRKIEDNLKVANGINSITVSLADSSAHIYFDDNKISHDSLAKKIAALKFTATLPNGKVYSPPSEAVDISQPPKVAIVSTGNSKGPPAIIPLNESSLSLNSKRTISSHGNTKRNLAKRGIPTRSEKSKEIVIPMEGDVERCFIAITGMTCASCVNNIERNIGKSKSSVGLFHFG